MALEYTPLRKQWPEKDTVVTAFRYLLVSALVENNRVLELGCGAGEGAELLAEKAEEYVGLDIAPRWSENDSAMLGGASFVQGDACYLPAEWQGKFDVVVAMELVEHLQDAAALRREIQKVLAPGGLAVLSTPNFDLLSRGCGDSCRPLYEHHVREYTRDEFNDYLKQFGTDFSVCGLSQLARRSDEPDSYTLVLDDTLCHLEIGGSYPAIEVAATEKLAGKLPLSLSQCFLGVVCNDRPDPASVRLAGDGRAKECPVRKAVESRSRTARTVLGSLVAMFSPRARSRALSRRMDACARSVEWILRRQHDHIRDLYSVVANRDSRIRETEDVLAVRNEHIESLETHVKNLEECLANIDGQIPGLQEQIRQLKGSGQSKDEETK